VRAALRARPDRQGPHSPFLKSYAGGAGGCPAGTHYLGIRPNGDVTPCPYLPLFGGNLKQTSLRDIWTDSDLFVRIRQRTELGGRCGACELNPACGGCRARAFGMTGDVMAEDPLCTHTPGTLRPRRPRWSMEPPPRTRCHGTPGATERLKQIPAFVRGMVSRRVEAYCREQGLPRVTAEVMAEIRAKMPGPKVFGRG
jgi:radical SAM protein with 4Fe4S-binding SPASM domain